MSQQISTSASHTSVNTDTMVIRSARGKLRSSVDLILTLLAWGIFLYLLWQGLQSAVGPSESAPPSNHLQLVFGDIVGYLLVIALQGVLLLLWASYNRLRFKGKVRRSASSPVSDIKLMHDYQIDTDCLKKLRNSAISIVHHTHDGTIRKITSSLLPLPSH